MVSRHYIVPPVKLSYVYNDYHSCMDLLGRGQSQGTLYKSNLDNCYLATLIKSVHIMKQCTKITSYILKVISIV